MSPFKLSRAKRSDRPGLVSVGADLTSELQRVGLDFYRKCSGERTGVRSIFKSFETAFFLSHRSAIKRDNATLCDRPDPCAVIELNVSVLVAPICALLTKQKIDR